MNRMRILLKAKIIKSNHSNKNKRKRHNTNSSHYIIFLFRELMNTRSYISIIQINTLQLSVFFPIIPNTQSMIAVKTHWYLFNYISIHGFIPSDKERSRNTLIFIQKELIHKNHWNGNYEIGCHYKGNLHLLSEHCSYL